MTPPGRAGRGRAGLHGVTAKRSGGKIRVVTVVVWDALGDFVVAIGRTNLFTGTTAHVPIAVTAEDLRAVSFQLQLPPERLTNVLLQPRVGDIQNASVTAGADGATELRIEFNPAQLVNGQREVAWLTVQAVSNQMSGLVALRPAALAGTHASGLELTNGVGFGGRLVVVGTEPVLVAEWETEPVLRCYGHPGAEYLVEYATNLTANSVWHPATQFIQTREVEALTGVTNGWPTLFYRARELSAARAGR